MTHPNRFEGTVAIVTGGAGAFGRAIAFQLVGEGASVVIGDVDLDAATLVAAELGDAAAPMRLDVTKSDAAAEAVAFAERQFGGLDILVNNAGLTHRETRLEDFTDESFDAAYDLIFGVNVRGTMYCSRHAIPAMRRRGGGAIVNTASIAAVAHRPGVSVYSSAKAGVVAFTRNLALELAPDIRVNAVLPVAADTPFMVAAFGKPLPPEDAERMKTGIPMGRLLDPSDVAESVAFLASADSAMITGAALTIDGGRSLG